MNRTSSRVLLAGAIAVSTALVLVACGGGGGNIAPVDALLSGTDIPASAAASSAGATAFVASLAAAPADSAEPIIVGDVVLASSDSAEPVDL